MTTQELLRDRANQLRADNPEHLDDVTLHPGWVGWKDGDKEMIIFSATLGSKEIVHCQLPSGGYPVAPINSSPPSPEVS